jgi:hypothetical protein
MRFLASDTRRRGLAAAAAGLLILTAASAAGATPPKPNTAAEAEEDDSGDEEPAQAANTAQPAPAPHPGQPAAEGLTHDDAVAATREGLRKSAIGSGIRRLRLLDYILIGGVGLLLILVLVLLGVVLGLRKRLDPVARTGTADTRLAREEEQLYGTTPAP